MSFESAKSIIDLAFLYQPCCIHLSVKEVFCLYLGAFRQVGVNPLCIGFLQLHGCYRQGTEG